MANQPSNKGSRGNPYDLGRVGKVHGGAIGWGRASSRESGGYDLSRRDPYGSRKPEPPKK